MDRRSWGLPPWDDQRWHTLTTAWGQGELLEPNEQAFVRDYEPQSELHAVEFALIKGLRERADDDDDGVDRAVAVEDALEAWGRGVVPQLPSSRRRWASVGIPAMSTLAAAAVLLLWVRSPESEPLAVHGFGSELGTVASSWPSRALEDADVAQAWRVAKTLGPSEPWTETTLELTRESSCIERGAEARLCGQPGTTLRQQSGRLELVTGTATLHVRTSTVRLSVAGMTLVTDGGTIDLVTHSGELRLLHVHDGRATLEGPDGLIARLGAGDELARGRRELSSVPADEPSKPMPRARHRATGQRDAATLLQEARRQRAASDFKGAARTLESLVRNHRRSSAAQAAHIALGQLYLGPLGDPRRALRHYDAYLRHGGSLEAEALYGKVRALRKLGQSGKAKATGDELKRRYPDSSYAHALASK